MSSEKSMKFMKNIWKSKSNFSKIVKRRSIKKGKNVGVERKKTELNR